MVLPGISDFLSCFTAGLLFQKSGSFLSRRKPGMTGSYQHTTHRTIKKLVGWTGKLNKKNGQRKRSC